LSIVKSLVHLHGGDVAIQSRTGEATGVTVRLPFEGGSGASTGDLIKFVPERVSGHCNDRKHSGEEKCLDDLPADGPLHLTAPEGSRPRLPAVRANSWVSSWGPSRFSQS